METTVYTIYCPNCMRLGAIPVGKTENYIHPAMAWHRAHSPECKDATFYINQNTRNTLSRNLPSAQVTRTR